MGAIHEFLISDGFQPNGYRLSCDPSLLWAHVVADSLAAIAYFSITAAILHLARRHDDIRRGWVVYMFSAFLVLGGVSHLMGIWTMVAPGYAIEGFVKFAASGAAIATASTLWLMMPKLAAIPSTSRLPSQNAQLLDQTMQRECVEKQLRDINGELEQRVSDRTKVLEEAVSDLRSAKVAAEHSARAKSTFLATMSHQIRTPMNSLLGMIDLIQRQDLDGEIKSYADSAHLAGQNLMVILDDILDYSSIESGRVTARNSHYNPTALIDEIAKFHAPAMADKSIDLIVATPEENLGDAISDPIRIRQILTNLLDNAIKFTDRGSIRIELSTDGEMLCYSISDTGCGVDQEKIEEIFERFNQVDSSTARRHGGVGLGLAISRELASVLGGCLDIVSKPGAGSRFTLTIPLTTNHTATANERRDQNSHAGAGAATSTAPSSAPTSAMAIDPASVAKAARSQEQIDKKLLLAGCRILIVEDNITNQFVAVQMIKSLGGDAHTAIDGQEGAIAASRDFYDVILMDINMPKMSGIEATAAIRSSSGPNTKTPIIAVTANTMPGDGDIFLSSGMDGYIPKPLDFKTALLEIKRVLAHHKDRNAAIV